MTWIKPMESWVEEDHVVCEVLQTDGHFDIHHL